MKVNYAHLTITIILSMLMDVSNSLPRPIVNGESADDGKQQQFPFAVSFGFRAENSSSFSHFCGGSIIATDSEFSWAISAAHCFSAEMKSQKIYAIIGGGDLSAATSSKHTKVCSVISTFIANFDQYSLRNDLALAKIDCGHQQVIELSEIEPFKSGTDCVIYGYGSLSFETSTQPSNVLYYGAVKPISYDDCERLLGRVTAPSPVSGQFCAQGLPPKYCDACSGDSGSSYICKDTTATASTRNQYKLVGVTSYGMGCGSKYSAGVYQSVVHHREWIETTLKTERQIDYGEDTIRSL